MKLVTAEELEATISEISTYRDKNGEFRKWVKATVKEPNGALMDFVRFRYNNPNHITEIDLLYLIFLGIKIGRGQILSEMETDF